MIPSLVFFTQHPVLKHDAFFEVIPTPYQGCRVDISLHSHHLYSFHLASVSEAGKEK
jgi:hypothetical protein